MQPQAHSNLQVREVQNKANVSACQAFCDKKFLLSYLLSPDLRNSINEVLNVIVYYGNKYKVICPSQNRISAITGISIRQVQRILVTLHEAGIIQKEQRFNHTSLFRLNPALHDPTVRDKLRGILKACLWLPFSLLTASIGAFNVPGGRYISKESHTVFANSSFYLNLVTEDYKRRENVMNVLREPTYIPPEYDLDKDDDRQWRKPERFGNRSKQIPEKEELGSTSLLRPVYEMRSRIVLDQEVERAKVEELKKSTPVRNLSAILGIDISYNPPEYIHERKKYERPYRKV